MSHNPKSAFAIAAALRFGDLEPTPVDRQ